MPTVPAGLIAGELANAVKWNTLRDSILELQAESIASAWVTSTTRSGWTVAPTNNQPMQTRGTASQAFLRGVVYTTTTKAAGSVICTVPANVRPLETFQGVCHKDAAGVITSHRFDVLPNGNVVMVLARGVDEYFLFNGVSWPLG